MIRVVAYMIPKGDERRARELGRIEITNDGSGNKGTGNYYGKLKAEYCDGRLGRVFDFRRERQSVWSLVGAFLKLWGHTRHSPSKMSKE